jgi:hypothetical protein
MSSFDSATTRALAVPELLLETLSHLDQASLYCAALVSREWRAKAQMKLYDAPQLCVRLTNELERLVRTERLARTLTSAPGLAGLVRTLCFFLLPLSRDLRVDDPDEPALRTRLLWLCTGLEELEIHVRGGSTSPGYGRRNRSRAC